MTISESPVLKLARTGEHRQPRLRYGPEQQSRLVLRFQELHAGNTWVQGTRSHARRQPARTAFHGALTVLLGCATGWVLANPGPLQVGVMAVPFLAAAAIFSLMAALVTVGISRSKKRVDRILRAGRAIREVLLAFGLAIAVGSAALAIVVAFYSLSRGDAFGSLAWRVTALQSVLLATGAIAGVSMPLRHPVIDIARGRVRTFPFVAESVSRVLVVGAWFTAAAILLAPASPLWVLTGVTLVVTVATWELGRRSIDRGLVDAFAQTAAKTASAASEGSSLLEPLVELERLSRHQYVAGGRLISERVATILRACVERLEPWERHDYRQETTAYALQELLQGWDDEQFRVEIGRFAVALRSAVVLGDPMAPPLAPTSPRQAFWREFWFGIHDVEREPENQPVGSQVPPSDALDPIQDPRQ